MAAPGQILQVVAGCDRPCRNDFVADGRHDIEQLITSRQNEMAGCDCGPLAHDDGYTRAIVLDHHASAGA